MAGTAPLLPLTSLRFFAALSVVLYHGYAPFLPSKPLPGFADDAIAVGFLGVSFFFVLSGFILAYNYLDPPDGRSDAALKTDPRSFLVARFARIYPLYLLGLMVHAPFMAAYRFDHDADPIALGKLLVSFGVNAGLVQGWLQPLRGGWNTPGWSLCAEAFFYALFPLIAPWLWRSRLRDRTLLALLFGAGLFAPVLATILEHVSRLRLDDGFEMIPLLRLPEFLFGIVLARGYMRERTRPASLLRSPTLLWVAGVLVLAVAAMAREWIPRWMLQIGTFMPAFALIILGFSQGGGPVHRFLSRRSLVLLGEASYGMYILHVPLGWWWSYFAQESTRLADLPRPFAVDQPLSLALYLAVLIGVSVLSVRWFEAPARNWIRRLDARIRLPEVAAAAKRWAQNAL